MPKNLDSKNIRRLSAKELGKNIFANVDGFAGFIKYEDNLFLLRELVKKEGAESLRRFFYTREKNPLHQKAFEVVLEIQQMQIKFDAMKFDEIANREDFIAQTVIPFNEKLKKFTVDYSINETGILFTSIQNVLNDLRVKWNNKIKEQQIDLGKKTIENLYEKYTDGVVYTEREGSAVLPAFNLLSTNREVLKTIEIVNVNAAVSIDDYAKNNLYNKFIQGEVAKLKQAGLPIWKSIRGDGNCYYRSVSNQLLEQMIVFKDETRAKFLKEKYADFYKKEDGFIKPEEFNKIIDGLMTGNKNSLVALQHILNTYNEFDLSMVSLMRNLTAEYMNKNPEIVINELPITFAIDEQYDGNLPLYIEEVVLKMGVDARDAVTSIMSNVLGVDISTVSLDIKKETTYTVQEFSAKEPDNTKYSNTAKYNLDKLHLYPFLKSGHYDAFRAEKLDQYIRDQGFKEVGIMATDKIAGELAEQGLSHNIARGFAYITDKLNINLSAEKPVYAMPLKQKSSQKENVITKERVPFSAESEIIQQSSALSKQAQSYIEKMQKLPEEYVDRMPQKGMVSKEVIDEFFTKSTRLLMQAKQELTSKEFAHVDAARKHFVSMLQAAEIEIEELSRVKTISQQQSSHSNMLQTLTDIGHKNLGLLSSKVLVKKRISALEKKHEQIRGSAELNMYKESMNNLQTILKNLQVKELEKITEEYFGKNTLPERKNILNKRYQEINAEHGRNLLDEHSKFSMFIDDSENLKALNTVAKFGAEQKNQLVQNNPLKNLSSELIYKSCDLKLLEKIANASQKLDIHKPQDYTQLSTKQKIMIGIATIIPIIGNLMAYGMIRLYNKGKEAEQLDVAAKKLPAPMQELQDVIQKNQTVLQKLENNQLQKNHSWISSIKKHAQIDSLAEKLEHSSRGMKK